MKWIVNTKRYISFIMLVRPIFRKQKTSRVKANSLAFLLCQRVVRNEAIQVPKENQILKLQQYKQQYTYWVSQRIIFLSTFTPVLFHMVALWSVE